MSTWGAKYDLISALRIQTFEYLRESFTDGLPRLVQKKKGVGIVFPTGKRPLLFSIIELFEGLWSVGTRFCH